jgi:arabinogalactan endo-1,4-beta-galactosidase
MILFVFFFLFFATSLALIPGDFGSANNGPPDGVVDFEDLMIFAMAYGSTPSDPNWNLLCDIAGQGSTTPDGVIDFEDLMIFAMHYGEEENINPFNDSIGGVFCDYLAKRVWDRYWKDLDPIQLLRRYSFGWVRVGVLTTSSDYLRQTPIEKWRDLGWRDEYWSCLEYAEQIMREATEFGMKLNLFFFLSHQAAHGGQQNAPPAWSGLNVDETCTVLEDYCYTTTKYFKDKGLQIDVYDIGNEIERGILNFRPGERIYLPPGVDQMTDMEYMRNNVWFIEAEMLKSAIDGVRRADIKAKIVLHIAGIGLTTNNVFVKTFFETMVEKDVAFDYIGLSYPYRSGHPEVKPYFSSPEFSETINYLRELGKEVIISEYSYPNSAVAIDGISDPGYPYTPEGQAAWIRDFRTACKNNGITRIFYFYPEAFPGMYGSEPNELESSGLFASDTQSQPALEEFNR